MTDSRPENRITKRQELSLEVKSAKAAAQGSIVMCEKVGKSLTALHQRYVPSSHHHQTGQSDYPTIPRRDRTRRSKGDWLHKSKRPRSGRLHSRVISGNLSGKNAMRSVERSDLSSRRPERFCSVQSAWTRRAKRLRLWAWWCKRWKAWEHSEANW